MSSYGNSCQHEVRSNAEVEELDHLRQ